MIAITSDSVLQKPFPVHVHQKKLSREHTACDMQLPSSWKLHIKEKI